MTAILIGYMFLLPITIGFSILGVHVFFYRILGVMFLLVYASHLWRGSMKPGVVIKHSLPFLWALLWVLVNEGSHVAAGRFDPKFLLFLITPLYVMAMVDFVSAMTPAWRERVLFHTVSLVSVVTDLTALLLYILAARYGIFVKMMTPNPTYFDYSRLSGLWGDPNFYALFVLVFFPINVRNLFHRAGRLPLIAVSLNMLTIVLTFSRFGWLCFALEVFVIVITRFRDHSTRISVELATLALALSLVLASLGFVGPAVIRRFTQSSSDIVDASSRFVLWKTALDRFNSPDLIAGTDTALRRMIGIGIGNGDIILAPVYGGPKYMHNTYLDLVAELGIVGWFFVFLAPSSVYRIIRRKSSDQIYLLALAIGVYGMLLSLSWDYSPLYFGVYFVSLAIVPTVRKGSAGSLVNSANEVLTSTTNAGTTDDGSTVER